MRPFHFYEACYYYLADYLGCFLRRTPQFHLRHGRALLSLIHRIAILNPRHHLASRTTSL